MLNEKEKKYIQNLIEPFKERVLYLEKEELGSREIYYVNIVLKNDTVSLPVLDKTWFEGLDPDEKYTLLELGL